MALWKRVILDILKMLVLGGVIYATRENCFGLRFMVAVCFGQIALNFLKKQKAKLRASARPATEPAAAQPFGA